MLPLRDSCQTVVERVQHDPAFARALLGEAATLSVSDKPHTARLFLRHLANATVSFEQLAQQTHKLSMDNLAEIFDAVGRWVKESFVVRVVEVA